MVDQEMISQFPVDDLESAIVFICRYARLAPSVHNTQPWHFTVNKDKLTLSIEPDRQLAEGDPTGRQTWISVGACLENLLLAAEHFGLRTRQKTNFRAAEGEPFLEIQFAYSRAHPHPKLLSAIPTRRTNRHPYQPKPLSLSQQRQLAAAGRQLAQVRVITDRDHIAQLAELTGRGLKMAFASPAFRKELSGLITTILRPRPTGIAGHSLAIHPVRQHLLEPTLVKEGWGADRQAERESQTMKASGAICLIFTPGDIAKYWLSAGRALQRLGLTAESLGLAQAANAAVVEAADFHHEAESLARSKQRLQALLRVGYSEHQPRPTRRLPLSEILERR